MDEIQYPATNHTEADDEALELIVSIVVPILFSLIAIIGFIGNILVIITVLCNQQMRNTTNLLILNLSFADLLFVCFCIPATAIDYTLNTWPFSEIWCKTVQYLITATAYISIYTLVLMSWDRFVAVCYPVSRIRSERNTVYSILVLWAIVIVINVPVFFVHGTNDFTHQNKTFTYCTFNRDNEFLEWGSYHSFFFISSYLIPLIFISILYCFMLLRLWRSNLSQSAESKRGKKRITRLVLIIVAAFAALWFPIQIILLLKSKGKYDSNSHVTIALQIVAHILAYTSSCINPLLYAFLSENFRKSFRKIISLHPSRHSRYLPTPTKASATSATNTN